MSAPLPPESASEGKQAQKHERNSKNKGAYSELLKDLFATYDDKTKDGGGNGMEYFLDPLKRVLKVIQKDFLGAGEAQQKQIDEGLRKNIYPKS